MSELEQDTACPLVAVAVATDESMLVAAKMNVNIG